MLVFKNRFLLQCANIREGFSSYCIRQWSYSLYMKKGYNVYDCFVYSTFNMTGWPSMIQIWGWPNVTTCMTVSFIRPLIWNWPSMIQIWGWPNVATCMTVSFIRPLIWHWSSMIEVRSWPNVTTCMTVSSFRPLWWPRPSMVQILTFILRYLYVSAHLTNVVYILYCSFYVSSNFF